MCPHQKAGEQDAVRKHDFGLGQGEEEEAVGKG